MTDYLVPRTLDTGCREQIMTILKKTLLTVILAAFSIFMSSASCYELKQQSLEEKASKSEFVFIGSVTRIIKNTQNFGYDLAIITPVEALKGAPPKDIRIIFNGTIPEDQPNCCTPGNTYLFFVSKNPKGDYYPVNGRYGIYPLSTIIKNGKR